MTKRAVFTMAQNAALREALAGLAYPSQRAAADALGIEQQNASRLMNDERSGFSYSTGSKVAQLAGYEGVDSFFSDKGVAIAPDSTTNLTGDPDDAVRSA